MQKNKTKIKQTVSKVWRQDKNHCLLEEGEKQVLCNTNRHVWRVLRIMQKQVSRCILRKLVPRGMKRAASAVQMLVCHNIVQKSVSEALLCWCVGVWCACCCRGHREDQFQMIWEMGSVSSSSLSWASCMRVACPVDVGSFGIVVALWCRSEPSRIACEILAVSVHFLWLNPISSSSCRGFGNNSGMIPVRPAPSDHPWRDPVSCQQVVRSVDSAHSVITHGSSSDSVVSSSCVTLLKEGLLSASWLCSS